MRLAITALSILFISHGMASAHSNEKRISMYSTERLLHLCKSWEKSLTKTPLSKQDIAAANNCNSYVNATVEAFSYAVEHMGRQKLFCLPENIYGAKRTQIFINWAKNHPEHHEETVQHGILEAMKAAFPCDKKEKNNASIPETYVLTLSDIPAIASRSIRP